jgi:hypothetical protein
MASRAAIPFSSRMVTLDRSRVEMIRLPSTSSASSRSSWICCAERVPGSASSAPRTQAGQT